MKKPRFSEQQIAVALRQAEQGTPDGRDLPQARRERGHVLRGVGRVGGRTCVRFVAELLGTNGTQWELDLREETRKSRILYPMVSDRSR